MIDSYLKILLVDPDEEDYILSREMLSEALGKNYEIHWASTFETGEQELKTNLYDAVLIEYDLGLRSGLKLIREASSWNYAAPFILYTGRRNKEVELEGIQEGATLYLPKDEASPFLLDRVIRFAIERKQLEIERKHAEDALRDSQTLLKAVLEGTQDPVYVKDRDSRILLANPALAKVVGKPVEDIIGKTDGEYYGDSQVGQALRDHDLMVMESGQSQAVEEIALTPQGYRTFLSSKAPFIDAAGNIIGIVGISRDITERKRMEMKLAESEEKLRNLIQYAPTAIYEVDFRGKRFISVNDLLCQLSGYSREELLNMNPFDILDEKSRDVFQQRINQWLAGEKPDSNVEYKVRVKDGRELYVVLNTTFVCDENGKPFGATVIGYDITLRKKVENELRESEERLRLMGETLPYGVWLCDPEGRAIYTSQSFLDLLEMTMEEMQGFGWTHRLPPEEVGPMLERWMHCVETGEDWEGEYLFLGPDGKYHTVLSRGRPVRDQDGKITCWVGINLDIDERKAMEQRLAYQAHLLENVHDAIIATDQDLRITAWNRAAEKLYGYTAEEVIGKLARDVTRPEFDPDKRQKAIQHMAETGVYSEEMVQYAKDGRRIIIESYSIPIRDSNGNKVGYVAANRDITLRKQVEEALHRNEELLVDYLESTHDLFFALDYDGHFIYANRRYCEMFGLNQQGIIGKDFWELFPRYFGTIMEVNYRKAMKERIPVHFETQGIYTDKWFEISANPTRDGISVFVIDRTGKHKAEALLIEKNEALIQLEEMFEKAFHSSPVGLTITRLSDGRFIDVNESYLQTIGYTREEVIGRTSVELHLHPAEEERNQTLDHMTDPGGIRNWEIVLSTKTGELRQVMYSKEPMEINGEPCILATVLDITDRKRAEKKQEAYAEELERSNQALQDFAFIASHDLKEPLRKIQTFGNMLLMNYSACLDEQGQDYIQRMQSAAGRMQKMLDGLLDYSRVAIQGRAFERIELCPLINSILSDLEVRLQETDGSVEVEELPIIEGDPIQIRQLLQNLIGNALKFHRPGVPPRIKIYSKLITDGSTELLVEDNGIGFDMRQADRLFQPFNRLVDKSDYEGTGMGLAICRKIVERHNGKIKAESTPGEGSRFIFTLPVEQH